MKKKSSNSDRRHVSKIQDADNDNNKDPKSKKSHKVHGSKSKAYYKHHESKDSHAHKHHGHKSKITHEIVCKNKSSDTEELNTLVGMFSRTYITEIRDEILSFLDKKDIFNIFRTTKKLHSKNFLVKAVKSNNKIIDSLVQSEEMDPEFIRLELTKKYSFVKELNVVDSSAVDDSTLTKLTNLSKLDLYCNKVITDNGLKKMTKLLSLDISSNYQITGESLSFLTNLTTLSLEFNKNINDDTLKKLSNLTSLSLVSNGVITDDSIIGLTNLKKLTVGDNLTDKSIAELKELVYLDMTRNSSISCKTLSELPELKVLIAKNSTSKFDEPVELGIEYCDISESNLVHNVFLDSLTNLRTLIMTPHSSGHLNILGDKAIKDLTKLTNLTDLKITNNYLINDEGIKGLTNLTKLSIPGNKEGGITDEGLMDLTNLTELNLKNSGVMREYITHLTNLRNYDEIFHDVLPNNNFDGADQDLSLMGDY